MRAYPTMPNLLPAALASVKIHRQRCGDTFVRGLPLPIVRGMLEECHEPAPRTPDAWHCIMNYIAPVSPARSLRKNLTRWIRTQLAQINDDRITWQRQTLQQRFDGLPPTSDTLDAATTQLVDLIHLQRLGSGHFVTNYSDGADNTMAPFALLYPIEQQLRLSTELYLALGQADPAEGAIAARRNLLWHQRTQELPSDQLHCKRAMVLLYEREGDLVLDKLFSSEERDLWRMGEVITCYNNAATLRARLLQQPSPPHPRDTYEHLDFLHSTRDLFAKIQAVRAAFKLHITQENL